MNEPATSSSVGQHHPLLADRARLDRINSNMDLTVQKVLHGHRLGQGEERVLHGGVSSRDVLQQALLELLNTDPASLSGTWEGLSVTIARCRAIDAVRRSVRGRRSQDSDPDAPDEINIVGLEQASLEQHVGAATDHDPEHAFVVNEQQKILLGLVRDLPERERAIFNAVHFEGRSRADVGRDLGVTPQRVGQIYGATLGKIWEQARSDPAFPSETDRKGDA